MKASTRPRIRAGGATAFVAGSLLVIGSALHAGETVMDGTGDPLDKARTEALAAAMPNHPVVAEAVDPNAPVTEQDVRDASEEALNLLASLTLLNVGVSGMLGGGLVYASPGVREPAPAPAPGNPS